MKIIVKTILLAATAITFSACGAPADNKPANNSNANTAKPTAAAAAPTADALLALDKQATEAFFKGDTKFFEGILSDKFVMYDRGERTDKLATLKMIGGMKCDIKDGWKLEDPQMAKIDADTYVLSYKGTFDGTCTMDGKTMKQPSPIRAATVWVRNGDKWQAVFHGENLIIDPKAPPATPAKPADKKDDKAATDAKPAAPVADPTTDAMMAVEKSVWEAWKAKDAKKIEDLTAKDITFVNIFGTYFANKADAIKDWTGATCDAKSFSLTDGVGTSVSPTVGILTLTGSVVGTCGGKDISGQKIYGTSVYVKVGDAWKWAFGFNSPA